MSKENENPTEGFLGNIAEELGTLSGTCNEIKEAQAAERHRRRL